MEPLRPEDPAQIGGYPLLGRLGAGGMGQVYLGLTGGGRHIAVKVIREDFEGPEALARFRREVATVERVRSRSAAAMVGAGLDAPPYWLATEYVPGPTLRQAAGRHGPVPAATCLRLLAALAQGLLEIHRQGVQHRDLKPGNVILAPDGPRLIDFGIARGEGQTQITQTGAWNGTPGYVAPEVVREQLPLPASDVFSLAGTIAYAATGRPPFGGGRIEAVLHRTLSGDIDVDGVEPRLADLLRRCAAKEPEQRVGLEQLLHEIGPIEPLAADPAYRGIVGTVQAPPLSIADAAASGLVPPDRTRTVPGGAGPARSRAAVIAAGAAVVAVVLGGAFAARFVLNGDDGETGGKGPNAAQAGPGANGGQKTGGDPATTGTSPAAAGRTPSADGRPPDEIFIKEPTGDFQDTRFSQKDFTCLPAVRPEDQALARDLQRSAPRQPVTASSIELSMRFKYAQPSGYYVAAQIRPPAEQQGNGVTGVVVSKPHLVPKENQDVKLQYPADFKWKGAGNGTYPLMKGVWTVIWMHVHPNGDAYFMACDGFTVA